ncbi:MAG: hypothetical protein WCR42_14525 [bacterium]
MKLSRLNRLIFLILPLLVFGLVSCDLINPKEEGPNDLGGDTDITISKPGNTYSADVSFNGTPMDLKDSIYIKKNDDGIVTMHISIATSGLSYKSLIPSQFTDAQGNIDTDVNFKVTSEGMQDFLYSDQDLSKPFTIVKYADGVGTKYEFTSKNGNKVTREITEKNEKDEWPLVFWKIKTQKIEETPDIAGVAKVIYRANHKYGLVYIEFILKDGTSVKIDLTPWAMV